MAIPTPKDIARDDREQSLPKKHKAVFDKFDQLTVKQRTLVTIICREPNLSMTEAVKKAGYKIAVGAKVSGIVKAIEGKLGKVLHQEFNLDEADLAKVARDALMAERSIVTVIKKYEDGKIIGEELVTTTIPDLTLRLKAFQAIAKLGGYEPAVKGKIDVEHTVKFKLNETSIETLRAREVALSGEIEAEYEVQPSV